MQKQQSAGADIGDYMKVFAFTAVMMQSVLALVLSTNPNHNVQLSAGIIYNLVKFTAPAFIFGILYTTTRTTLGHTWHDYPVYLRKQWSALFVPTIWWTLAYLLLMPKVQQHQPFNNFGSFLWQMINGNAAPHLWYNTMMLQFILLMPLFWLLGRWTQGHLKRGLSVVGLTLIGCGIWLWIYAEAVLNNPASQHWYMLDRLFISFVIYGIFGVLAVVFHRQFNRLIQRSWWVLVLGYLVVFYWTNWQLRQFGFPVKLTNAPYYQVSMTLYSLLVIGLIAALAIWQLKRQAAALPVIHFLATYAYRAYLSNVFWLQIIWRINPQWWQQHPVVLMFGGYLATWVLAFCSAYGFHLLWQIMKHRLSRLAIN